MKTLSFHEFQAGRPNRVLLDIDSTRDSFHLVPGLNLLVAPNGYGKSTFLQTLGGLLKPLRGHITIQDSLGSSTPYIASQHALLISEYLTFPKFILPSEWIEFVAGPSHDSSRLAPHWEGLRLTQLKDKYLGRMSQGERRKVTWLAAHASNRPVLLLDEPLDGLDLLAIDAARNLLKTWQKEGKIVLLIAHQISEVFDLAQQTLVFENNRLKAWESISGQRSSDITTDDFRKWTHTYYTQATRPQ